MKKSIQHLGILLITLCCFSFIVPKETDSNNIVSTLLTDYCDGWEDGYCEGWKDVKGQLSLCPIAPICPIAKIDCSEGYRCGYNRGFKAGMKAAKDD